MSLVAISPGVGQLFVSPKSPTWGQKTKKLRRNSRGGKKTKTIRLLLFCLKMSISSRNREKGKKINTSQVKMQSKSWSCLNRQYRCSPYTLSSSIIWLKTLYMSVLQLFTVYLQQCAAGWLPVSVFCSWDWVVNSKPAIKSLWPRCGYKQPTVEYYSVRQKGWEILNERLHLACNWFTASTSAFQHVRGGDCTFLEALKKYLRLSCHMGGGETTTFLQLMS